MLICEQTKVKRNKCYKLSRNGPEVSLDVADILPDYFEFIYFRDVVQPGRALAWGARCRRFESSRPDQIEKDLPCAGFFVSDWRAQDLNLRKGGSTTSERRAGERRSAKSR